jgi:dTMP kinase
MGEGKLFLCFTGMDGTGKTTHALATKRYLESRGSTCSYIKFRYQMAFVFSFMLIALAWLVLGRKRPVDERVHRNSALTYMWLFSSMIDYSLYIFCRILPVKKNVIICDRYIVDTLVRLSFNGVHSSTFTKILVDVAPHPDLVIHLDVPPKIALKRKKENSLQYYITQRRMYKEILRQLDFRCVTIDTSEDYGKIRGMILERIEQTKHKH